MCTKDKVDAEAIILDNYEYEEGIPLRNVPAFKCPVCGEFIFTEAQVDEMENKTDMIKAEMLAFERKVTVSGRSLVINLPEDLVRHMHIMKGQKVRIRPAGKRRFIVEAPDS
nr:YgiT-type zinc finger protein [Candidatus Sigynarchaeum springense]